MHEHATRGLTLSDLLSSEDGSLPLAVSCPICGNRARPGRDGRCGRCRALVARPRDTLVDPDDPRWLRALRLVLSDPWLARGLAAVLPGRVLPLVVSYATAVLGLALVHQTLAGAMRVLAVVGGGRAQLVDWLQALLVLPVLVPCLALLALIILLNAREMMMMALARRGAAHQLGCRTPLEDARFWAMRLRGRRAFAVHVTFRTDRLPPTARVGLEVTLMDEAGKVLPAALPRYRAPDGEFLARELSAPIGLQDDFLFTLGTLVPVTALSLRAEPGTLVRLRARVALTLDGVEQVGQELTTSFRAREGDFPAPPRPRDEAAPEAATVEEMAFVGEVDAAAGGCPVCGDGFDGEALLCDGCHVPHHPECWAFAGRCSTYGCDGEASMARQLVRASRPAASAGS